VSSLKEMYLNSVNKNGKDNQSNSVDEQSELGLTD